MRLMDRYPSNNHFNVADAKECSSRITDILFILTQGDCFTDIGHCIIESFSIASTTIKDGTLNNEHTI